MKVNFLHFGFLLMPYRSSFDLELVSNCAGEGQVLQVLDTLQVVLRKWQIESSMHSPARES